MSEHDCGHRERTNRVLSAVVRALEAGAKSYIRGGLDQLEFTEEVFTRWYLAEVKRIREQVADGIEHDWDLGDPKDFGDDDVATALYGIVRDLRGEGR